MGGQSCGSQAPGHPVADGKTHRGVRNKVSRDPWLLNKAETGGSQTPGHPDAAGLNAVGNELGALRLRMMTNGNFGLPHLQKSLAYRWLSGGTMGLLQETSAVVL